MARYRWTLALFIICLPILATVITAFRVRDLPKSYDSSKLYVKKTQKCENCDVKVDHRPHSVKIDSEKHKLEALKKVVHDKPQNLKQLDVKSTTKFNVMSKEDDEVGENFDFPKSQFSLKQEKPEHSSIVKSTMDKKTKVKTGKISFSIHSDDEDDDDDEDDNTDNDDNQNSKKTSTFNVFQSKMTIKLDESTQINVNKKMSESKDTSRDISVESDSDNGDDNDENNNYDGLENIEELFKILDMRSKIKNKENTKKHVESLKVIKDKKKEDPKKDKKAPGKKFEEIDNSKPQVREQVKVKTPVETKEKVTDKLFSEKKQNQSIHISKDISKESSSIDTDNKEDIQPTEKKDKSETSRTELKSVENNKISDTNKVEEKNIKGSGTEKDNLYTPKKMTGIKERTDPKTLVETSKIEGVSKTKQESINLPEKSSLITDKEQEKPEKKIIQQNNEKIVIKEESISVEHKKDIKYDFQKPNAHKDSHKNFNYSEFEKMHVSKAPKKDKSSCEKYDSHETKTGSNFKHVTDALHRRNLLKSEFEDFYAFYPTFAPNFSRIHNPECRRHGQILMRQLRGTKLWALNMLDATAKIPSGVLQGNGIQLGDFDQCLGSRARVQLDTGSVVKVQGKYCLAKIDVKAEHTELEGPVYLAQAKNMIRSRIDDPGHFVPRFSTLSWGVCVPSACDSEDTEVLLKDAIKHYQHRSGLVIKVKVDEEDCHTDENNLWEEWLELPTLLTLSFYGIIVLLVFVATVQDYLARREPEERRTDDETDPNIGENKNNEVKPSDNFISSFSLYHTIGKLIAPGTSDEISCIHGIRGLATLALLVAHKFMPVAVMPYTNRLKIAEIASSPLWSWCRAGWIFTDCFLLLSGTLTAYRIASDKDKGALRRLLSRYLRLTPALLAVVLFYAYVWDKLSSGPMWGAFVTKNAKVCQEGWWWNLLYVQNYFGMENMCAPQTHQLALDMQLTILGGIVVWLLQSVEGFLKLILPAIHLLAAYLRYSTVQDHRLTLLAYHGVSVSQLYRTARLSYTSTLHRCSPYLIGISLGMALKKPSHHGKLALILGWLTSSILWGLVIWSGIDSGSTQYRYNASYAAQYATIAPLASAMAIAWVIYAAHTGSCDLLSRWLCWRPLVFISRLSYALYLCQFIIFITNIGTVRTSREFTLMSLIDIQEISAILLTSTILTLTFVIPMQSLNKVFSFKSQAQTEISTATETNTESITKDVKDDELKLKKRELQATSRNRHNLIAHREVLEEIPEVEVEYETQRESTEGLDEIIEEEEEDGPMIEEDIEGQIDDLEIIEEEEAGEEESWLERQGERSYARGDDQDLDEWEWTANGRSGAQYSRYTR